MKINICTKSDQYKKISLQLIFSIGTMKININKKLSDLIDYNQYPMLRVPPVRRGLACPRHIEMTLPYRDQGHFRAVISIITARSHRDTWHWAWATRRPRDSCARCSHRFSACRLSRWKRWSWPKWCET